MATHAYDFGRASALPLSVVLGAIPSYPRPVIEQLVARLIEHLDEEDGDADLEHQGDEQDHSNAEDDFINIFIPAGSAMYQMIGACEDDEDDDPAEDEGDREANDDHHCGIYGIDQTKEPIGVCASYFREAAA